MAQGPIKFTKEILGDSAELFKEGVGGIRDVVVATRKSYRLSSRVDYIEEVTDAFVIVTKFTDAIKEDKALKAFAESVDCKVE